MLAGTILASAATTPSQQPTVNEDEYLEYDDAYLAEIDATVDQYFEEHVVEFQEVDYVKVFNAQQELLVEGVQGELDEEGLKLLRQADKMSEFYGTAYYQINK